MHELFVRNLPDCLCLVPCLQTKHELPSLFRVFLNEISAQAFPLRSSAVPCFPKSGVAAAAAAAGRESRRRCSRGRRNAEGTSPLHSFLPSPLLRGGGGGGMNQLRERGGRGVALTALVCRPTDRPPQRRLGRVLPLPLSLPPRQSDICVTSPRRGKLRRTRRRRVCVSLLTRTDLTLFIAASPFAATRSLSGNEGGAEVRSPGEDVPLASEQCAGGGRKDNAYIKFGISP